MPDETTACQDCDEPTIYRCSECGDPTCLRCNVGGVVLICIWCDTPQALGIRPDTTGGES